MCRGFLSGRVARDRRRTSFEGAKGRAKDSETATQRRDRKLLIKEKTLTNVGVFFICINLKGSRTKVSGRIRERCHPSHRFFTPCHISVFLLSHKAFLSPFRMTIEGESVMMRGTIRRHNEGNVNRHPERM